jgi:hypothetical protein
MFPVLTSLVPVCPFDCRVEGNVWYDLVLLSNAAEVCLDFRAHGELLAPVRVQLEAVAVEMRGDITAASRICVHEPGTSDISDLLDDLEVSKAVSANELDGHA